MTATIELLVPLSVFFSTSQIVVVGAGGSVGNRGASSPSATWTPPQHGRASRPLRDCPSVWGEVGRRACNRLCLSRTRPRAAVHFSPDAALSPALSLRGSPVRRALLEAPSSPQIRPSCVSSEGESAPSRRNAGLGRAVQPGGRGSPSCPTVASSTLLFPKTSPRDLSMLCAQKQVEDSGPDRPVSSDQGVF